MRKIPLIIAAIILQSAGAAYAHQESPNADYGKHFNTCYSASPLSEYINTAEIASEQVAVWNAINKERLKINDENVNFSQSGATNSHEHVIAFIPMQCEKGVKYHYITLMETFNFQRREKSCSHGSRVSRDTIAAALEAAAENSKPHPNSCSVIDGWKGKVISVPPQ